jgi:hypothetical protein
MWVDISTGEAVHQGGAEVSEPCVSHGLLGSGELPTYRFLQAYYARRVHAHVTRQCDHHVVVLAGTAIPMS